MQKIMNIGIVVHVDAGKTSLTESLYQLAHQNYTKGRIEDRNTLTDTLVMEKERGITIKTSSVALEWKGVKLNLLDMPGHIEFFGEVARSLAVVDSAILVVASNEAIRPETRRIFDVLKEANIPTIIFLNKTDLASAEPSKRIAELKEKVTANLIEMPLMNHLESQEMLIEANDTLLEKFLNGEELSYESLMSHLLMGCMTRQQFPLFQGSAIQNQGGQYLLDFLTCFAALIPNKIAEAASAIVYKIAFIDKQKNTYLKLASGTLCQYDKVVLAGKDVTIKRLLKLERNQFSETKKVTAGEIFMLPHQTDLKIGDQLGDLPVRQLEFPLPSLRTTFSVCEKERLPLLDLLTNMQQEDPLLNLEIAPSTNEITIMTYGKVQQEYIEASLRTAYPFQSLILSAPQVIYKERVSKSGIGHISMDDDINPYWATITIAVHPNQSAGIRYQSFVSGGYLKSAFQNAIEESVMRAVRKGIFGLDLIDTDITLTGAEFFSPVSTPSEFRHLAPYALYKALLQAGTEIVEPKMSCQLFIPQAYLGKALSELEKRGAAIQNIVEQKEEIRISVVLLQSSLLSFEAKLNEWFSGQAYLKYRLLNYEPTLQFTNVVKKAPDLLQALLLKEQKK